MQTVNLTLMWWLGHGATAPEAVVVYDVLSPTKTSLDKKALCRFALGPEVWTPRAEFDANGEWLGTVTPPMRAYHPVFTPPTVDKSDELPPPPSEIVVPAYASAPPAREVEAKTQVDELVVDLTLTTDKSEDKGDEDSAKRRGPPGTPCPPEVEVLLGTDKDTLIAAQTGFSLHLINKWRTERGIPRYVKSSETPKPVEPVEPVNIPVVIDADGAALVGIIAMRFPEGASDEDMANEACVPVAKVVEARLALGLRRPRGRKPGVPQGPRKAKTDTAESVSQEAQAPTENVSADEDVQVQVVEGKVDAELDALLA